MAVTYTARVDVTGEGRNGGTARSADGLLEHTLAIPKELGGAGDATNPEQLFAAGWAACFLGALRRAAAVRHIKLTSTAITAEITLTHGDDGEFRSSSSSPAGRPRCGNRWWRPYPPGSGRRTENCGTHCCTSPSSSPGACPARRWSPSGERRSPTPRTAGGRSARA
ncbi:OsmC family protein [Streptomyces sp. NPDC021356]|uniref:OsmC family protein n=1 Tax=Streptomyces sp. NPDC021356 TaxID=3154900 RepID=UPI0033ECD987